MHLPKKVWGHVGRNSYGRWDTEQTHMRSWKTSRAHLLSYSCRQCLHLPMRMHLLWTSSSELAAFTGGVAHTWGPVKDRPSLHHLTCCVVCHSRCSPLLCRRLNLHMHLDSSSNDQLNRNPNAVQQQQLNVMKLISPSVPSLPMHTPAHSCCLSACAQPCSAGASICTSTWMAPATVI